VVNRPESRAPGHTGRKSATSGADLVVERGAEQPFGDLKRGKLQGGGVQRAREGRRKKKRPGNANGAVDRLLQVGDE